MSLFKTAALKLLKHKLSKPKKTNRRTFGALSSALPGSSFCSVVIAAAGSSSRCGGKDKLLHDIAGKPVLLHTIDAFQKSELIREIIVVTKPEQLEMIANLCMTKEYSKVSKIIAGGETRTLSVYNGIYAVSHKAKYIAVHDGARACVDPELIERTLRAAVKYHAAAPGVPVTSTIKKIDKNNLRSFGDTISETIDRDCLVEIQTPQIFKIEIITAALTAAIDKSIPLTDECMAVELIGMPVHVVQGSSRNIKITEPDDLLLAELYLKGCACDEDRARI